MTAVKGAWLQWKAINKYWGNSAENRPLLLDFSESFTLLTHHSLVCRIVVLKTSFLVKRLTSPPTPPLYPTLWHRVVYLIQSACGKKALFSDVRLLTQSVVCIITHAAILTQFIMMEALLMGVYPPSFAGL